VGWFIKVGFLYAGDPGDMPEVLRRLIQWSLPKQDERSRRTPPDSWRSIYYTLCHGSWFGPSKQEMQPYFEDDVRRFVTHDHASPINSRFHDLQNVEDFSEQALGLRMPPTTRLACMDRTGLNICQTEGEGVCGILCDNLKFYRQLFGASASWRTRVRISRLPLLVCRTS
jgi:hypothetical protein